jgi:hypothetical protein
MHIILTGTKVFSPFHSDQNRSGAHPASYAMATGALFPVVKKPGRKGYPSPQSSAEVKDGRAILRSPICLYVLVFNELIVGTVLSLHFTAHKIIIDKQNCLDINMDLHILFK